MTELTWPQKIGTGIFALLLVIMMLVDFFFCCGFLSLRKIGMITRMTQGGLAVIATKFCWSIVVLSCFWIRTIGEKETCPGIWDKFIADLSAHDAAVKKGAPRQPYFILSNHLGYFDTFIIVVYTPVKVLRRIRCYMGSFLFGIPVFATICKVIGHFPVYFLKSEDGKFSVDQTKMSKVETWVEEHLNNGGILNLFPEGAVNKNPGTLQTFRHGTFKKALEKNAKIWHFVLSGHEDVWPHSAPIAAYPASTGIKLIPVCPQGAKFTVAKLREKPDTPKDISDHQLLAEYCRAEMQKQYDELKAFVAEKESGDKIKAN